MCQFKVGDCVRHRTGGPLLRVTQVYPPQKRDEECQVLCDLVEPREPDAPYDTNTGHGIYNESRLLRAACP